ncbi:MAG: beta-ketoacyl-ACP synthase III [Actinomycetota bacterium]
MPAATITGWGRAVPDRVVTNEELADSLGVDTDWIVRRTGIRERRIAGPHERTSSLAVRAGKRALARAGVQPQDLDLVVVATTTPDRMCPATAPLVQLALGAGKAGAFDLNAACAGFMHGLAVCSSFIASGAMRRCLVIGAEVLSRFVDWNDPSTCVLFGDGAGAVVLERTDEAAGLLSVDLGADGTGYSLITIPAGGSERPASAATLEEGHLIHMDGREVFRAAVRTMAASSERALRDAGLEPADIDLFICHQANQRIVSACAERLGLDNERVVSNVARYGNTSAASVPIALSEAADEGRLQPGSTLVLTAIGAGLVWGTGVVRWTAPAVRDGERASDMLVGTTP